MPLQKIQGRSGAVRNKSAESIQRHHIDLPHQMNGNCCLTGGGTDGGDLLVRADESSIPFPTCQARLQRENYCVKFFQRLQKLLKCLSRLSTTTRCIGEIRIQKASRPTRWAWKLNT